MDTSPYRLIIPSTKDRPEYRFFEGVPTKVELEGPNLEIMVACDGSEVAGSIDNFEVLVPELNYIERVKDLLTQAAKNNVQCKFMSVIGVSERQKITAFGTGSEGYIDRDRVFCGIEDFNEFYEGVLSEEGKNLR